jgi:DNA (cytosine-5)-methyltransferase 1
MADIQPAYAPKVLDLFCGAGGIAYGFARAGYRVTGGTDIFQAACDTFVHNFEGAAMFTKDIRKLDNEALDAMASAKADVIVGGPSCQGFSTAGGLSKKEGRDPDDSRNRLFMEYLRVVEAVSPSWIVFENVPGLLLYNQGRVAVDICEAFASIGYTIQPMILLAADYGVPQLRRRLIFVGNRTGHPAVFPQPTHGDSKLWASHALPFAHLSRIGGSGEGSVLPHVTFDDACGDLPSLVEGQTLDKVGYGSDARTDYQRLMRDGQDVLRQHTASTLCETDRLAATTLKPGEYWKHIPLERLPERFSRIRPYDATTILRRLDPSRPSYTVTTKFNEASTGAFIHPSQPRTVSIREAARLQSFPDTFFFHGSDAQVRRQIGNAVPPLLAQAVAEAILPYVTKDATGLDIAATRAVMEVATGSERRVAA